ncbi:MAG: hypothetical protein K2X42_02435 [Burkholderiaceae bacterium]|nr:hypothetical protein [Burkholderiaceae bacterium]
MTTLTERFNKLLFNQAAKGVLATPPLARGKNDFAAVSMVQHRDVVPYLVAIKSFALFTQPARVVLVADPTLDHSDRAVLRQHLPYIEIVDAVGFRRPALPVGGCWERLSAISVFNAETSVVQVDADTVTQAPLDEVVEAALSGTSFVLRSEAGVEITSLDHAAEYGRKLCATSGHIQPLVESRMNELPAAADWRYARGCAGFTGFGRGALNPQRLDDLSSALRTLHGQRWNEWGTEQVTSNLLAASAPGAFMLPHPRYCNADSQSLDTRLAHYIGYARFTSRRYEQQARQTISRLMDAKA